MMDSRDTTLDARLAARLRQLRTERGLTLDGLAERSGVSRSMISLVERGESSPTAAVLDRLAAGLDVTIAALFAEVESADAAPLARRVDQPVWRDPGTGYVRRNLSPPGFPSPLELVEVVLLPAARVAYDTPGRAVPVHQQVYVLEGELAMTVGADRHDLAAGDCLAMRLDHPVAFHNPSDQPARYIVALANEAALGGPRR